MDALQFFLLRYEPLHSPVDPFSIDSLFSTLSETQLRHRPRPDLNSIAWIVWHMARRRTSACNGWSDTSGRRSSTRRGGWPAYVSRCDIVAPV